MENFPYSKFTKEDLLLRDVLAVDRTILSNERNLLAYIRTSLALLVTGATLIHFFGGVLFQIAGWVFIPAGISVLVIGVNRYRNVKQTIEQFKKTSAVENS